MTTIDPVQDGQRPEAAARLDFTRILAYLGVIAAGLPLGAVVGLIIVLFTGLLPINC